MWRDLKELQWFNLPIPDVTKDANCLKETTFVVKFGEIPLSPIFPLVHTSLRMPRFAS